MRERAPAGHAEIPELEEVPLLLGVVREAEEVPDPLHRLALVELDDAQGGGAGAAEAPDAVAGRAADRGEEGPGGREQELPPQLGEELPHLGRVPLDRLEVLG